MIAFQLIGLAFTVMLLGAMITSNPARRPPLTGDSYKLPKKRIG